MTSKEHPIVFAMSRQALPTLDRTKFGPASGLAKGGYVLSDAPGGTPDVILIGTGSEVHLCVEAAAKLAGEGIKARVVSLPSWELFDEQTQEYKDSVLPPSVKARVSVEMGTVLGWEHYVGTTGGTVGMHTFGASAPLKDLLKHFGFTVEEVVKVAKKQLGKG
jgi:transketolase